MIETFGGIAPEAQTLNRKLAIVAEEHSVVEERDDFMKKLKNEVAAAVQYGNYRMTTMGIQQSKIKMRIPTNNPGLDSYIEIIISGEEDFFGYLSVLKCLKILDNEKKYYFLFMMNFEQMFSRWVGWLGRDGIGTPQGR